MAALARLIPISVFGMASLYTPAYALLLACCDAVPCNKQPRHVLTCSTVGMPEVQPLYRHLFSTAAVQTYVKGKKGEAIYLNGDMESNPANQDGYYSHTEITQKFERVRTAMGAVRRTVAAGLQPRERADHRRAQGRCPTACTHNAWPVRSVTPLRAATHAPAFRPPAHRMPCTT